MSGEFSIQRTGTQPVLLAQSSKSDEMGVPEMTRAEFDQLIAPFLETSTEQHPNSTVLHTNNGTPYFATGAEGASDAGRFIMLGYDYLANGNANEDAIAEIFSGLNTEFLPNDDFGLMSDNGLVIHSLFNDDNPVVVIQKPGGQLAALTPESEGFDELLSWVQSQPLTENLDFPGASSTQETTENSVQEVRDYIDYLFKEDRVMEALHFTEIMKQMELALPAD